MVVGEVHVDFIAARGFGSLWIEGLWSLVTLGMLLSVLFSSRIVELEDELSSRPREMLWR